MTLRQQILAAVRGERIDGVPFTCYQGLLPDGAEEIENLCVVGSAQIVTINTPGVTVRDEEAQSDCRHQIMETPWGNLTRQVQTEAGYGSSWTKEHWIRQPQDYETIESVIRHSEVTSNPEPYRDARTAFGDGGVVLAWTPRAPIQRLWIEYTGIQRMAYDLADRPDTVNGLLDAMFEQSRRVLKIAAESEAELVWVPDNITGDVASPAIFERFLIPYYREVCDILLPAGKTPCCHMDGMLGAITESIAKTDLPVIEAFTPPPDGNLSVTEGARRWPEKTLWLNFPSSVHLSPQKEIERITRKLVNQADDRPAFLIGVTENIPDSVGAESLKTIGRVLQ